MAVTNMTQEQQLVYHARYYEQQISSMQQQEAAARNLLKEVEQTINALKLMKGVKKGEAAIVPLGAGTFASAKMDDPSKVFVDVGAGVMAEKKAENAISILDKRRATLVKNMKALSDGISQMVNKHNEIAMKLSEMKK